MKKLDLNWFDAAVACLGLFLLYHLPTIALLYWESTGATIIVRAK